MKKKKNKKIKPINKLKIQFEQIELKLKSISDDCEFYKKICFTIKEMVGPRKNLYGGFERSEELLIKDIPNRVLDMKLKLQHQEGAELPAYKFNDELKEIIRWLIKPSTAENKHTTIEQRMMGLK